MASQVNRSEWRSGLRTTPRSLPYPDKPRVRGIRLQLLLHQTAAAEETRPHCPDGDAERFGGRLVRLVFDVDDDQRRAERLRDPGKSAIDRGSEVETDVHVIEAVLRARRIRRVRSEGFDFRRLQLDRWTRALSRPQKDVSTNREQPSAAVATGKVGVPRAVRAEERVLNDVIRVALITGQGQRKPIDVVDPRHSLELEGDATFPERVVSGLHVCE